MSNILIVHAHPEPLSLTSALKDLAITTLRNQGHVVQVSDLYAMGWKAIADEADFTDRVAADRLSYVAESRHAFASDSQSPDIEAEQKKLLWADAVLFSFPLWWFGAPAILKGWFDRVFTYGFAYGVGQHGGERWGDRYGEGVLAGRRAMLVVPIGGRLPHYSDRGVNGSLDDILWPLQHGTLFYPGFDVLPAFPVYQSDRMDDAGWGQVSTDFCLCLENLFTVAPIPFRTQNGGHYDASQRLKPGLGGGEGGTHIHLVQPGDPVETVAGRWQRAAF
ncbi:NAD(P)H-dependent oxidoreductase [Thalassospira sp. MCCC 1A01428]|uniref:NAD(P)H-dependent oxidoreductase n=1 Tax=Thalassospira sp. MCCC 1A01428 TaxID=1470575 RepID=UPI000A1FCA24|nr:NAD(P)H-dependent oxidoreductase [Thalassospira sp. MCCC 1A01428]OSQ41579.1 NAD(P)H dehydrogenase [Thalassospira sp. MCCC 1A01428]